MVIGLLDKDRQKNIEDYIVNNRNIVPIDIMHILTGGNLAGCKIEYEGITKWTSHIQTRQDDNYLEHRQYEVEAVVECDNTTDGYKYKITFASNLNFDPREQPANWNPHLRNDLLRYFRTVGAYVAIVFYRYMELIRCYNKLAIYRVGNRLKFMIKSWGEGKEEEVISLRERYELVKEFDKYSERAWGLCKMLLPSDKNVNDFLAPLRLISITTDNVLESLDNWVMFDFYKMNDVAPTKEIMTQFDPSRGWEIIDYSSEKLVIP